MHALRRVTGVPLLLLLVGVARGEDWVTPDGMISVAVPAASRFAQIDQPGLAAVWVSHDGRIRLAVADFAMPQGAAPISVKGVEEGAAKEMNGTLIESRLIRQGPHEVLRITCQADVGGQEMIVSQLLIAFDGRVYKAMAVATDADPRDDPDGKAFLDSFEIRNEEARQQPFLTGSQASSGAARTRDASYAIGYYAGRFAGAVLLLLLFVLVIRWLTNRGSAGRVEPPPLPQREDPPSAHANGE